PRRRCHSPPLLFWWVNRRGSMTTAWTWLYTMLHGRKVGSDSFGNRYYRRTRNWGPRREQRWVVYRGEAEASKVPPPRHAWLHYITDQGPATDAPHRPWEKPHLPNLTGTPEAYLPPGHTLLGGHRPRTTGDYEPWTPS